jgi:hypothetical protein
MAGNIASIGKYYFGPAEIEHYTDKSILQFTNMKGIITGLQDAKNDTEAVNYKQLTALNSSINDQLSTLATSTTLSTLKTRVDTLETTLETNKTTFTTQIKVLHGTINSLNTLLFGNQCDPLTETTSSGIQHLNVNLDSLSSPSPNPSSPSPNPSSPSPSPP